MPEKYQKTKKFNKSTENIAVNKRNPTATVDKEKREHVVSVKPDVPKEHRVYIDPKYMPADSAKDVNGNVIINIDSEDERRRSGLLKQKIAEGKIGDAGATVSGDTVTPKDNENKNEEEQIKMENENNNENNGGNDTMKTAALIGAGAIIGAVGFKIFSNCSSTPSADAADEGAQAVSALYDFIK